MYFFTELMPFARWYLLMQILTTHLVMIWSFAAHKYFCLQSSMIGKKPRISGCPCKQKGKHMIRVAAFTRHPVKGCLAGTSEACNADGA